MYFPGHALYVLKSRYLNQVFPDKILLNIERTTTITKNFLFLFVFGVSLLALRSIIGFHKTLNICSAVFTQISRGDMISLERWLVEGLEAGRQASIDSESTYRSAGGSSSGAAEAPKPSPPFALAAAPAGTGSTSAAGAAAAGNLQSGGGNLQFRGHRNNLPHNVTFVFLTLSIGFCFAFDSWRQYCVADNIKALKIHIKLTNQRDLTTLTKLCNDIDKFI